MGKLMLLALVIFWLWATSGPREADPQELASRGS
jgi:hypothetical protein